jgi:protein-tyrosine phosphatase
MKYAITFFLLACLISGYAIHLGGWWHLLHWCALSCLVLAIGYAGLGARVFGKRPDGTIPVWSKVIHLPFLLYRWFTWNVIRTVSRENSTDQITPDLIIGRRLHANERFDNIGQYIDLTAEFEEPKEIRESPEYLSVPILDGGIPTVLELSAAISRASSGLTYVHCAQGHGRTGMFALALLAARRHIQSIEDGLDLLKKMRPGVGLNSAQMQFIRNYMAEQVVQTDAEDGEG